MDSSPVSVCSRWSCAAIPAVASSRAGHRLRPDRRRVARERARHGRGPGDDARRARRAGRPLHGALGPGGADRARESGGSAGSRLRLVDADEVLDALHSRGIDVVLQLDGAPAWSNGGKPSNYVPTRAASFGAFATAVAHEYPWIQKFQIWNEPNQARWLRPTSAPLYVTRLLNPAYAAIHAATKGAKVAGGGTRPRGSTGGVSPLAWITAMHRAHARLDVYAHNPYPLDPKRETPLHAPACGTCTTVTMATLSRLERLVARDFPRARIWLTEYGYQSNPPDRILGVPRTPGALHRRRRVRRVSRAARRSVDPLPLSRRADPLALPERPRHAREHAQAGARRLRATACRDRPVRIDDKSLGAAARTRRRDRRRPRASDRRDVANVRADQREWPRLLPLAGDTRARSGCSRPRGGLAGAPLTIT